MSAFVRRQQPGAQQRVDTGTRPGLHGQVLVSTGLAGLDKLLGGGLPLGSLLLVVEDAASGQAANLARCFLGEGVCCRHTLALVAATQLDDDALAAYLPAEAKPSSSSSSSTSQQAAAAQAAGATGAASAPAPAPAAVPDDGLKIAWQYRKYIQRAEAAADQQQQLQRQAARVASAGEAAASSRSSSSSASKAVAAGIGREWCHQFDLTRPLPPEQLRASKLQLHCCCPSSSAAAANGQQQQQQQQDQQQQPSAVQAAAAAAEAFLARFQPQGPVPVPSRDPASVGRLVVQSLGAPEWWPGPDTTSSSSSGGGGFAALESAMLTAVARIRLATQDANAAVVLTCPAGMFSDSFQAQLQHLADAVLWLRSLADGSDIVRLLPDATSAAALLEVRRLPSQGLVRPRLVEEPLHLLRTKRRSITVGPLDLVPLEAAAAAGGDDAGAGGGRSAPDKPAVACGGGARGGGGALDF